MAMETGVYGVLDMVEAASKSLFLLLARYDMRRAEMVTLHITSFPGSSSQGPWQRHVLSSVIRFISCRRGRDAVNSSRLTVPARTARQSLISSVLAANFLKDTLPLTAFLESK